MYHACHNHAQRRNCPGSYIWLIYTDVLTVKQPHLAPSMAPAETPELSNYRYEWYVVLVLAACYALSFVDRQILSLLVGPIKHDLHISDTRIGLLQGLAFSVLYTFMGLPLGRWADSANRRNLIMGGVLAWSALTTFCSAAKSFLALFLARIGVGIGEASLSPSTYSMVADYFPRERFGVALSVLYMGVFVGSSLALMVGGTTVDLLARTPLVTVPLLGLVASWRLTFVIVGLRESSSRYCCSLYASHFARASCGSRAASGLVFAKESDKSVCAGKS